MNAFSDHIVCDTRSRSEVVIPLMLGTRLLGVLDVDSPHLNRFSAEEADALERLAKVLVHSTAWPERFV